MIMSVLLALCSAFFLYIAVIAGVAAAHGSFPRESRYTLTWRECLFDLSIGVAGAVVCVVAAWRW